MNCKKCMKEIPEGSTFCEECMAENIAKEISEPITEDHHNFTEGQKEYQPNPAYNTGNIYNNPPQGGYMPQNNYGGQNYYNNPNNYRQNQPNSYPQPASYYPPQYYDGPDNFDVNQPNQKPAHQRKRKNYTALIIIISVCFVAVIVCAMGVVFDLTGGSLGTAFEESETDISASDSATALDNSIVMIDCTNTKYEDAKNTLEGMGLVVKSEYKFDNYFTKDTICGQSIPSGNQLKKGDTVILYISKGSDTSPEGYNQKVVVTASAGSSSAKLKLYNWENGEWKEIFSCSATVGKNGISSNYGEGISATPKGTFKLGYLIASGNSGRDNWPFYKATANTCIIDDSSSYLYNQIIERGNIPSGTGYDRIGANIADGTCCGLLFIEHNGDGSSSTGVVRGNGSAITICGINGSRLSSTYGCVDIKSSDFHTLMSSLDYNKNPHIELKN